MGASRTAIQVNERGATTGVVRKGTGCVCVRRFLYIEPDEPQQDTTETDNRTVGCFFSFRSFFSLLSSPPAAPSPASSFPLHFFDTRSKLRLPAASTYSTHRLLSLAPSPSSPFKNDTCPLQNPHPSISSPHSAPSVSRIKVSHSLGSDSRSTSITTPSSSSSRAHGSDTALPSSPAQASPPSAKRMPASAAICRVRHSETEEGIGCQ